MANLETTYLGLKLRNPLIAGSSGLTNSLSNLKELVDKGIGAIVLKSIFEEQIQHETEHNIKIEEGGIKTYTQAPDNIFSSRIYDYEEAYSYIYEYAKKHTLNKYLNFIESAKKEVNVPIIASINCVSGYDWHNFAKQIQDAGADAIELNIYVLPSDFRHNAEDNEKLYYAVYEQVKQYVTIPISIKLGYYFSALAQSIENLSKCGVNGLVLFNRPYNPDIDIEKLSFVTSNILSSETEYANTLRWMSILSGHTHCDLAAATGIHHFESTVKQILAGANAVQLVSTLYVNKFDVVSNILMKMDLWMNAHKFKTIDDFRGKLSSRNLENPAAIERVQFMKLYAGIE
jgi:dihydroorotate dehydrogenase (fumarate)